MNILAALKPITTFVLDIDGVLTNGQLLIMPNGLMARSMQVKDGYAMQLAVKKGYNIIIISGGDSPEVIERMQKLGITEVHMKVKDKWQCLQYLLLQNQLKASEVLFMGDDMPDIEVMQQVAVACCPADAALDVLAIAAYISPLKGGEGCVRDVIEKVLKLNNHWHIDTEVRSQ